VRAFLLLLVLLTTLAVLAGGGYLAWHYWAFGRSPWRQPDVLLVTIDTLRADHLSPYEPKRSRTPTAAALARRGTLFTQCLSQIPITLPSHASLFSGRMPHRLQLFDNTQPYSEPATLLAQRFAAAGYRTGAFISLGVLKRSFHLNRGFQTYDDHFPTERDRWYRLADEITGAAQRWLGHSVAERPNFLWLHYSDPHEPYTQVGDPPDTFLYLNGKKLAELHLARKELTPLRFEPKPGANTLRFEFNPAALLRRDRLNRPGAKPNFAYLDQFQVLLPGGPATLQLGDGWNSQEVELHKGAVERLRMRESATARFTVSDPAARQGVVVLKGGIYLSLAQIRRSYRGEVEYADASLAKVLEELRRIGRAGNTLIILTADHGEGLGQHQLIGHVDQLYDSLLRVPLIVVDPFRAGRMPPRLTQLVRLVDLAPTILELCELPPLPAADGRSLVPLLRGHSAGKRPEYTLAATFTPEAQEDLFAIRSPSWKLIYAPARDSCELYDLRADPGERKNVFAQQGRRPEVQSLEQKLEHYVREVVRVERDGRPISAETRAILHSLGYAHTPDAPGAPGHGDSDRTRSSGLRDRGLCPP
jgi:arylsulfatase A-like enzyme